MSKSQHVKDWRKRTKARAVEAFGGKCCICGYSKNQAALQFHHIDSETKNFGLGEARSDIRGWDRIVDELRKCVLVCMNCHIELHHRGAVIPSDAPRFNEAYAEYRPIGTQTIIDKCPICSGDKPISLKFCSTSCSSKRDRANWGEYDIVLMKKTMTNAKIAELVGVSETAVRKKMKRILLGSLTVKRDTVNI